MQVRGERKNGEKEIDFVVNYGDRKVYIQSAFQMDSGSKTATERIESPNRVVLTFETF